MTKSKQPLVSVIIPAYNAQDYIGDAINSVLEQTYKNIEVIIIDDKSTDETSKIAATYAKNDKRIIFIKNDQNLGIGGNRSKGLELAKGEYICWQDADDISIPDRIEKQVDVLESKPKAGVVGGWLQFFSNEGEGAVRKYSADDKELRSKIFMYNPVAQPASMFRSECFDKVGGYNEAYKVSEDLEMLFRVGEEYEFANVQAIVLKYRQSSTSLTATKLREMEKTTLQIRDHYKNSPSYNYTFADTLYNLAQRVSLYMPTKLRMFIFKLIRGDS